MTIETVIQRYRQCEAAPISTNPENVPYVSQKTKQILRVEIIHLFQEKGRLFLSNKIHFTHYFQKYFYLLPRPGANTKICPRFDFVPTKRRHRVIAVCRIEALVTGRRSVVREHLRATLNKMSLRMT